MSTNSARLQVVPIIMSLVVSVIAMTCYCVLDECLMNSIAASLESQLEKKCPDGYFGHQRQCYHHLGCNDLKDKVLIYDEVILNYSPTRIIKLAQWNQKKLLVKHHSLNNLNMELKFKQHLSLYKTVLTDQLIGYCDAPGHLAFLTEFHKSGGSNHPQRLQDRILLCLSYAELLEKIHQHELSLDFDEEEDFFESVLIVQDPWRIILEDIQMLKPINNTAFDDIWMAPQICNSFLLPKDKEAKLLLTDIHKQCRDKDPERRPNAHRLFKSYREVSQKLQLFS